MSGQKTLVLAGLWKKSSGPDILGHTAGKRPSGVKPRQFGGHIPLPALLLLGDDHSIFLDHNLGACLRMDLFTLS